MPEEETQQPPTETKTEPAPQAPPEEPPEAPAPPPQIDTGLQKRIYDIQERFLRRDATLGAMAEAGELSEFMFSICDNASTAKAIKEVCGILNIEVDDFFATYGYDPSEDDEEEEDEDEEGEEGEEDFDEEEEEEEEAPEPPPPPEPKKARRKSPLLDNDLIQ